jgi:hypothetical protein
VPGALQITRALPLYIHVDAPWGLAVPSINAGHCYCIMTTPVAGGPSGSVDIVPVCQTT